ncbi:wax ester/triacylglycerol synthase family O-acyltransferase [Variovorax humicola]|uniref:diacylglycerol O-acyltransferase n=1 Tax=Variovorax humicola TaxID=1769758 RepID=A0ABU8VXZ8_9BURK
MKHLSGMDSTFLHIETPEMPMHVGSLHVLDLPEGYAGDFYEDAKAHIAGRLHLADVFTRKLAQIPFDLSNPVWVDDDDVDLDYHVRHITLPKPGTNRQLQQYVARLHSSLLDRSRPLWEYFIIDGLRSGQVALYAKTHHSAIDGASGLAMGRAIFDLEPTGRVVKPSRQRERRHGYQLGMAELAAAALRNSAQQYLTLAKMVPDMVRAMAGLASAQPEAQEDAGETPRARSFNMLAPRTSLNVSITNQRSFAGRTIPVAETKQIARHFGVTLNDVVMATVAGALRSILTDYNELPDKPLIAGVPVSLREAGDETANNQVSGMLVSLCTDIADPVERMRQIRSASGAAKARMSRFKDVIPDDIPMFAAPWLMSGMASLYSRSGLANMVPPLANVAISNVPGAPVPLYFAGARMTCYYPVSMVTHGVALNITVHSYNGRMDYGFIACRRALPDLNDLGDCLLAEHRLLLGLVQQAAPAAVPALAALEAVPEVMVKAKAGAKRPARVSPGTP